MDNLFNTSLHVLKTAEHKTKPMRALGSFLTQPYTTLSLIKVHDVEAMDGGRGTRR